MSKGYIKIENNGEIDINALFLLGATSKREDESKIGYFGSGLKYALAVMFKNDINFRIFSGEKEIKVSTTKDKFRGREFDVIKINNRKTSFTTDMGPDWKAWFAIREIYCNAIDEGEYDMTVASEPIGEKDKTIFYIENSNSLKELFENWNKYFSDKREDIVQDISQHGMKLYSGNSQEVIVYRKGVQAYEEKKKSLFHYDIDWITINESRVVSSTWAMSEGIARALARFASVETIKEIFDNYAGTFEEGLKWQYVYDYSDAWLTAIDGRKIIIDNVSGYFLQELTEERDNCLILPADMVKSLKDHFGKRINVLGLSRGKGTAIDLKMSSEQIKDCEFAKKFLADGGVEITEEIQLVKFDKATQLGGVRDDTILISTRAFELGRKEVVLTILEEHAHIESGHADETRSFQNFLINKWVREMEIRTGNRL